MTSHWRTKGRALGERLPDTARNTQLFTVGFKIMGWKLLDLVKNDKLFYFLKMCLAQGRRHGFSPVGARFPIYIVHCVLAEFQWGQ